MATVAYLTHPIGEADADHGQTRGNNLANAMDWLKFLIHTTRWVICCPWFVYIAAVDGEFHRARTMRDQILLLDRCDIVVLTGGIKTPHMLVEIAHATRKQIPIVDLLHLGRFPPWEHKDRVGKEIEALYKN